jgi:hypothetical protein
MSKSLAMVYSQAGYFFALLMVCLPLLCIVHASAQDQTQPSCGTKQDTCVVKLDKNHYRVGSVLIDKGRREITLHGWVNMNDGPIEYLAVAPGGKTHESVLVLDVQPLHLQLALLLFGLDYGQNLGFQGDSAMPMGDRVKIQVNWINLKGKQVRKSASEIVKDLRTNKAMKSSDWVFTGSTTNQDSFMADMDGSIIAVYSDPVAILNNPLGGRVDDTVYGSNKETLPPPGTKITMTIKALRKEK